MGYRIPPGINSRNKSIADQWLESNTVTFGGVDLGTPTPTPGGVPLPEPVPPKPKPKLKIGKSGKLELAEPQLILGQNVEEVVPENKLILGQNVEEVTPDNQLILGQNVEEVKPTPTTADNKISQLEQIYNVGGGSNWGAALVGLGESIAGRNPTAAVANVLNNSNKAIEEPLAMQRGLTEEKARQKALEKAEKDQLDAEAKKAREADPNSDESKVAQELALEMGYTGDITKLTAERFRTFSPALSLKYEKAMKAADREAEREAKKEAAEAQRAFQAEQNEMNRQNQRFIAGQAALDRQASRETAEAIRAGERTDKKVDKLGDTLQPLQSAASAIGEVQTLIGSDLDDLEVKDGRVLTKTGKPLDLPGVSVPGVGRVSFYSGDARTLRNAAAGIFNRELKTRSGAAVTNQELERLKQEFGEGKFNTEAELIQGLKRYKRALAQAFKDAEARAPKDVVTEYESRGGQTSSSFSRKAGGASGGASGSGNRTVANSADDL